MYRNTKTGMPGGQWRATAATLKVFEGQRVENHEKDSAAARVNFAGVMAVGRDVLIAPHG